VRVPRRRKVIEEERVEKICVRSKRWDEFRE